MRLDTTDIVTHELAANRQAYVLVNHRLRGCAPMTIQALIDAMAGLGTFEGRKNILFAKYPD